MLVEILRRVAREEGYLGDAMKQNLRDSVNFE